MELSTHDVVEVLGACETALEWAVSHPVHRNAYDSCERPDWIMWAGCKVLPRDVVDPAFRDVLKAFAEPHVRALRSGEASAVLWHVVSGTDLPAGLEGYVKRLRSFALDVDADASAAPRGFRASHVDTRMRWLLHHALNFLARNVHPGDVSSAKCALLNLAQLDAGPTMQGLLSYKRPAIASFLRARFPYDSIHAPLLRAARELIR